MVFLSQMKEAGLTTYFARGIDSIIVHGEECAAEALTVWSDCTHIIAIIRVAMNVFYYTILILACKF